MRTNARETVQTDAVNKIHADVAVEDASHGWNFSIADIGKEARARLEKLNEKLGKPLYRFFSPHELVQLIASAQGLRLAVRARAAIASLKSR
jgi:hypothetical protein